MAYMNNINNIYYQYCKNSVQLLHSHQQNKNSTVLYMKFQRILLRTTALRGSNTWKITRRIPPTPIMTPQKEMMVIRAMYNESKIVYCSSSDSSPLGKNHRINDRITPRRTNPIPALAIAPWALENARHKNRHNTQMKARMNSPIPIPATVAMLEVLQLQ